MKRILTAFIFFTHLTIQASAQIDSMIANLPVTPDTLRVQALNNLSFEFAYSDPEKGKQYGFEALALSEKLHYTLGKAKALNRIGIIHDVSGNYDSAIYCYFQAGILYAQLNNIRGKGSALNNAGMVYAVKGRYQRALGNYFEALRLFELDKNENDVASAYNNIGNVYADLNKFDLALKYYYKASTINLKYNNEEALASNYTNIASSNRELGRLDSALIYGSKSVFIQKKLNNYYGLGIVYAIVANTYSNQKEYHKAIQYLLESWKYREMVNDKAGEASLLLNISDQYMYLHDNRKALEYAHKAHDLALALNSYRILRKTSILLFQLYTQNKQYETATSYVATAMMAKDSALNEESSRQMADMEVKYESEKKALEIEKQQFALQTAHLEIEQKQSTIIIIIILSVLILAFVLGVYSMRRHTQQRKFDQQIIAQQELRNKAIIEAEEKERIRIARELHDGIGQQLSATKMNMSVFEVTVPEKDKGTFQMLIQLVDDAVKEVRTVSHNLIPNALIRSGLSSAVRDFVHKINNTDTFRVDLQIIGLNTRLEKTTEAVLYRVLQESVNNIIKHAQATEISIQLVQHPTYLNMLIEDNGIGFDTQLINQSEGIGLKNMISRIQFLNGTIDFDSTPGKGTTVIIDIPLV